MSRLIAIGDIHGCARAFETLLAALELTRQDTLVLLGDYVDRGPASQAVLERILELRTQVNLVPLLGNHEEMMLEAAQDVAAGAGIQSSPLSSWVLCGGEATLESYGGARGTDNTDVDRLKRIPDEHWRFLMRQCRNYYETATHIFVHATVLPDVPLAQQPAYALRWRKLYHPLPHESGKTVVVGHTIQPHSRPRAWPHTIAIDTGAYTGEHLTALSIADNYLWQANESGNLRHGPFEQFGQVISG